MPRLFYHTMQDNLGNLLFGVSGTMRLGGTGTLATIYGDEAMTVILPNPMSNHSSYGSFKCYLDAGVYDFYMAKPGYSFETLTGVQGSGTMAQQDADYVNITGGNAILASATLTSLGVTGTSLLTVLGVGTEPTHTLHVGGSSRLGDTGIGTTPQPGNALSVAGRVSVDGDVGIHTVPAYPLDVTGLVRLGNVGINALPTAPNALAVTGRSTFDGDVGIHTLPAYPLDVIGLSRLGNVGINALPTAGNALAVVGHVVVSNGNIGVHVAPSAGIVQSIHYEKNSGIHGILLAQRGAETGSYAIMFTNLADVVVGSIATTASATAFNTTSDARLKHAIAPLTGALDVVRGLRPVRFRWNANDEADEGFIGQELQNVIPRAVSGGPDEVHEDGSVKPMQVDHSKLVVWLVSAVQELAARVVSLEQQLGV